MRAMMAYMATRNRGENQQGGNRNEMRGGNRGEMYGENRNEMRGGNRSEMYGETGTNEMRRGRQPNQYTRRNGMN